jgi:hypothetical protein
MIEKQEYSDVSLANGTYNNRELAYAVMADNSN